MSQDEFYVGDMLIAAREALDYVKDMDEEAFRHDTRTQRAVERTIEIIGEAAKSLSESFRDEHPVVPWKDVAGMRDRIIHQYRRVDLGRVWQVVTRDLPDLIERLEPLVPREET